MADTVAGHAEPDPNVYVPPEHAGQDVPPRHPPDDLVAYASSDGQGFVYDQQTLHELVTHWRELADEYKEDQRYARSMANAQGPGLEYASAGNAEMIRASGEALLVTLKQRVDYCRAMAAKYVTALGKYATAEETHATEIAKPGGSL